MTQFPDFPIPIADDELVRRAVTTGMRATTKRGVGKPRWFYVPERFGLGSTYAQTLCRRFGADPDQLVGKP